MTSIHKIQRFGLWGGLASVVLLLMVGEPEALSVESRAFSPAWITLCLLVLMAIWWVSEAIPIPVTAMLPLVVLPITGTRTMAEAAAPYMHPVVVLLMGGFIFAKALERWNLHQRIALNILVRSSGSQAQLVGGFMIAAALLSMWISNTATCLMMVPIALSVTSSIHTDDPSAFRIAMLLGIAYGCSIGGLGTPIGTPTNLIVMGYLTEQTGIDVSFAQWAAFGMPVVLVLLPLAWLILTRIAFRLSDSNGGSVRERVQTQLAGLGPMTIAERRTIGVFIVVATLWIFRRPLSGLELPFGDTTITPFAALSDHATAIVAVLLCFLIPAGMRRGEPLLDWSTAEKIPWGIVLLFGGGMSLASAINETGLGLFLGQLLSGAGAWPIWLLLALLTAMVLMLTEVTSNIATASALMPVMGALGMLSGVPIEVLAAPVALAASCAFMFPMATGPNAVVFAAGQFSMLTMARAGLLLNLIAIVVIVFASLYLATPILGSAEG